MKSKEQVKDLLEQYEFDKEMDNTYFPENKDKYQRRDLIIDILKWVLEDDVNNNKLTTDKLNDIAKNTKNVKGLIVKDSESSIKYDRYSAIKERTKKILGD